MSRMHANDSEPVNNAKSCETTKPEKECPMCGEKTNELPNHILRHCPEK